MRRNILVHIISVNVIFYFNTYLISEKCGFLIAHTNEEIRFLLHKSSGASIV